MSPTGILSYKLPEENEEFRLAQEAGHWQSVVTEIDNWLRGEMKYRAHEWSEEGYGALQKCRDKLTEFCQEEGVFT